MNNIYDLICEFLNSENSAAGLSAYESLPTGKPLKMEDNDTEKDDLGSKIQKIRDQFKEMKK